MADDGITQVYDGTAAAPHTVIVDSSPTLFSVTPNQGPVAGGTTVTLSGSLFQAGSSVLFGAMPAASVNMVTANQLTCVTPPHFPAFVDVTVVNPDESIAVLLNGYQYLDTDVVLSMPDAAADYGDTVVVPLQVSNVDGMLAASATVTFDSSVIQLQGVAVGDLTFGWSLESNSPNANTVNIALANSTSASGNGDIVRLTFDVVGAADSQSPLTISNAQINGTTVDAISQGTFTVNGYHSLAGSVSYYGGGGVPGAALNLVGVGSRQTSSGSDGGFLLENLQTGAYTLTPSKSDDAREITAYDASLVLQAVAGSRTLSANETIAADVDRLGGVTALDASYILQKSVSLIGVPFPGAGRVWDFVPNQRTYANLNADLTGQDFTAILLGDPSANWTPPAAGAMLFDLLDAGASLAIPVVEGSQSQQVVLPVEIQRSGATIHSVDMAINYDAQELLLVGVQFGPAAAGLATAFNPVSDGEVLIGLASGSSFAQDGTLVNLYFDVLGSLATPTEVTIASARLDEGNVAVITQDGAVQETVVENPLPGDANRDGTVNQADAAILSANWLMPSGAGWADGDFNGDERVDDIDSTLMAANWHSVVGNSVIAPQTASKMAEMPAILPGDANHDGTVDVDDAAVLALNWQKQAAATWAEGDFNADGSVDDIDAAILARHWMMCVEDLNDDGAHELVFAAIGVTDDSLGLD